MSRSSSQHAQGRPTSKSAEAGSDVFDYPAQATGQTAHAAELLIRAGSGSGGAYRGSSSKQIGSAANRAPAVANEDDAAESRRSSDGRSSAPEQQPVSFSSRAPSVVDDADAAQDRSEQVMDQTASADLQQSVGEDRRNFSSEQQQTGLASRHLVQESLVSTSDAQQIEPPTALAPTSDANEAHPAAPVETSSASTDAVAKRAKVRASAETAASSEGRGYENGGASRPSDLTLPSETTPVVEPVRKHREPDMTAFIAQLQKEREQYKTDLVELLRQERVRDGIIRQNQQDAFETLVDEMRKSVEAFSEHRTSFKENVLGQLGEVCREFFEGKELESSTAQETAAGLIHNTNLSAYKGTPFWIVSAQKESTSWLWRHMSRVLREHDIEPKFLSIDEYEAQRAQRAAAVVVESDRGELSFSTDETLVVYRRHPQSLLTVNSTWVCESNIGLAAELACSRFRQTLDARQKPLKDAVSDVVRSEIGAGSSDAPAASAGEPRSVSTPSYGRGFVHISATAAGVLAGGGLGDSGEFVALSTGEIGPKFDWLLTAMRHSLEKRKWDVAFWPAPETSGSASQQTKDMLGRFLVIVDSFGSHGGRLQPDSRPAIVFQNDTRISFGNEKVAVMNGSSVVEMTAKDLALQHFDGRIVWIFVHPNNVPEALFASARQSTASEGGLEMLVSGTGLRRRQTHQHAVFHSRVRDLQTCWSNLCNFIAGSD